MDAGDGSVYHDIAADSNTIAASFFSLASAAAATARAAAMGAAAMAAAAAAAAATEAAASAAFASAARLAGISSASLLPRMRPKTVHSSRELPPYGVKELGLMMMICMSPRDTSG